MENLIIAEAYLELLDPLVKWRILPLDLLKNEIQYIGKASNFYKRVSYLEKQGLLESFINPITKKKFSYLTGKGFKLLGAGNTIPTFYENRFHDSICSQVLYAFLRKPYVESVLLEHEIEKQFSGFMFRPDGFIKGKEPLEFKLALECELTQKSKDRIIEKFLFYSKNQFFNNVLYVFNQAKVYKTYSQILETLSGRVQIDRFVLLYCPSLDFAKNDFFHNEVTVNSKKTTLEELFSNRGVT